MQAALARVTRTLEMVNASNQALIHAKEEQLLLADICRIAVEVGGYRLAWVGYAEDDAAHSVRPVAIGGPHADYVAAANVSWADTPQGRGPTGTCIRENRTVVNRDFSRERAMAPWRAKALRAGFRSSIAIPLKDGRVFGALTIYAAEAHAFDEHEAQLLEELAGDLAFGVLALRTRAAQRSAEAEVRRSEARYRTLVNVLNDGLVEVDGDFQITFVNAKFAKMMGSTPAELLGRRTFEFISEDEQKRILHKTRRKGALVSERYEVTWRRPDGVLVPTLCSAQRTFDEKGAYQGSISVISDLSALRAAEAAREQLANIVDTAVDGISAEDLNGVITAWNRGAEQIYGYTAEEMIGRSVDILAPPELRGEGRGLALEVLAGRPVAHHEIRRQRKDGENIYVAVTLSPLTDFSGRIVGVSRIFRDITAKKRTEQEREQYLRFFRLAADAMVIADISGHFLRVNPRLTTITGYSEEELTTKPFYEFIHPDDRGTTQARHTQLPERPAEHFENRYVCKDGSIAVLSWTAYFDAADGVVYATARDVTETKRIEAELAAHRRHLEQMVEARTAELAAANKDLEAFAYSVSHDLRAPLRAVDGFSQILVEDYGDKLDPEGRHVVTVIREGAQKMGQMIEDILAFSRAGRLELKAEPVDMGALARTTWADLQASRGERQIAFEVGALPTVQGDAAMLARVWQNLLDNAIKYTGPKPDARVEVSATTDGGEAVFCVRDNGVGFDMTYVDKLWGVFQRLHGAEFPGSGIGLAIVKRIVTRHGGRVWAESKLGEGAAFYFTIPTRKDAA